MHSVCLVYIPTQFLPLSHPIPLVSQFFYFLNRIKTPQIRVVAFHCLSSETSSAEPSLHDTYDWYDGINEIPNYIIDVCLARTYMTQCMQTIVFYHQL
ncbi:hypothetical protein DFJ43DRAFT_1092242 [Lentinula guzmanii]|uniref:Uncharacterized protein n=1 Tax=Lentinula guzmanii TaxID=2804957 RepID=A0AA38MXA4_9AGAR|nr:hypothetical protein DFJ43DRAFT_1092242 [Lentinula guzmanii]